MKKSFLFHGHLDGALTTRPQLIFFMGNERSLSPLPCQEDGAALWFLRVSDHRQVRVPQDLPGEF